MQLGLCTDAKNFLIAGKKRTTRNLKIWFIIQSSLNPMVEHHLMPA